ncbi:hypothetical protein [Corynebacterium ulcerans]|nr:hypothetical protein [Corynebacterium ulcerans]
MEELVIDFPGVIHASWKDEELFSLHDGTPTKKQQCPHVRCADS